MANLDKINENYILNENQDVSDFYKACYSGDLDQIKFLYYRIYNNEDFEYKNAFKLLLDPYNIKNNAGECLFYILNNDINKWYLINVNIIEWQIKINIGMALLPCRMNLEMLLKYPTVLSEQDIDYLFDLIKKLNIDDIIYSGILNGLKDKLKDLPGAIEVGDDYTCLKIINL